MRTLLLSILVLAATSAITALALSGSTSSSADTSDREAIIEDLKPPIEASSVESYRMRSTTTFSGSIAEAMRAQQVVSTADVTEDPRAVRVQSEVEGPDAQSGSSVQIGDQVWFDNGEGWQQASVDQIQGAPVDTIAQQSQRISLPGTSITFELASVIRVAEFAGTEEVHGFDAVRYTIDMDDFRTLLDELLYQAGAYDCQTVTMDDQGNRTVDSSECSEEDLEQDLGAADNVDNFQGEFLLTSDGFVIQHNVTVELANLGQVSDQPGTITVDEELYDFNSGITVEPPVEQG